MGQKNKGRPKWSGDRQAQSSEHRKPHRERKDGRPQQGDGPRKPRQGDPARKPRPHREDKEETPRSFEAKQSARPGARDDARPRKPFKDKHSHSRSEERRPPREERTDGFKPHQHERLWIYGRHAAIAAIANPRRKIKRILATDAGFAWIDEARPSRERRELLQVVAPNHLDAALHPGAVHQGIAVEVEDLPRARLKEDCAPDGFRPVVVLDQITDPHNIGAIIRSAAAFKARAIIVQDRRTPPLAGALAKAAAGAVEVVPCVEVVNVARALEGLKALGYHCAGLAGESGAPISSMPKDIPIALVLGAEGAGLRKLVRDTCDAAYAIPIDRNVDSLNVSTAAAVALYEISRR